LVLNKDGLKLFGGSGEVSGRSFSLTADLSIKSANQFIPGNNTGLDMIGKVSQTSQVFGMFGYKTSGSFGSDGFSGKIGIGLVSGRSSAKPVIGFKYNLFEFE
jgi:hypothetical protein